MDIKLPNSKLPQELPKGFKPSPIMVVNVGDGKLVAMNRRARRRQGLYGSRLVIREPAPNPPAIYHSIEERDNDC